MDLFASYFSKNKKINIMNEKSLHQIIICNLNIKLTYDLKKVCKIFLLDLHKFLVAHIERF